MLPMCNTITTRQLHTPVTFAQWESTRYLTDMRLVPHCHSANDADEKISNTTSRNQTLAVTL